MKKKQNNDIPKKSYLSKMLLFSSSNKYLKNKNKNNNKIMNNCPFIDIISIYRVK
jgi:hypothetical protein